MVSGVPDGSLDFSNLGGDGFVFSDGKRELTNLHENVTQQFGDDLYKLYIYIYTFIKDSEAIRTS
jgi:hypothetical protein